MGLLHSTREYNGYGKQNYYHNEYVEEGDRVVKYKCHDFKSFDGKENSWHKERTVMDCWKKDDPDMPDWLRGKMS